MHDCPFTKEALLVTLGLSFYHFFCEKTLYRPWPMIFAKFSSLILLLDTLIAIWIVGAHII